MSKSLLANKLKSQQKVGHPHLVIIARAGTGKTTTLVEGLKFVMGSSSELTPSEQQKKIWFEMTPDFSQGEASPKSVCFVAFNKSIADELQRRVPQGVSAMTMHSMGLKAVTAFFGRVEISKDRVQNILSRLLGKDIRELRRTQPDLIQAMENLVGLCKQNLTELEGTNAFAELDKVVTHYDVPVPRRTETYTLVQQVITACKDVSADRCIDFNDMIWIPVALGLPVQKYELLLVDEAQDLNRCQQQLALKAGHRLILCGDPAQAIYGFAGADSDSIPNMEKILSTHERGCLTLPLTVTRRCGKAIVKEAQKTVPDFEAYEGNSEGFVGNMLLTEDGEAPADKDGVSRPLNKTCYRKYAQPNDMILCRVNAPLVSECFKFLKEGRKANIQGRDIGQGLVRVIKSLKCDSVVDLIGKLDDWRHRETEKELAKRNPNENKMIQISDRHSCLLCFTTGARTVDDVITKIESIFTDNSTGGIKLSSIHKAKGLEAQRVFFLMPKGGECPHPMAKSKWQKEQERNLLYVGITRAIKEMIYVR